MPTSTITEAEWRAAVGIELKHDPEMRVSDITIEECLSAMEEAQLPVNSASADLNRRILNDPSLLAAYAASTGPRV